MPRTRSMVAPIAVAVVLLSSPAAHAGDKDDVGAQMYRRYCGACHGLEGKGDGVVSGFMRPQPPDLTQLSKTHNGEFPLAHVMRVVDGRERVPSHGNPDMPVWGEILKGEGGVPAQEVEVHDKILLITEHLRRIQAQ